MGMSLFFDAKEIDEIESRILTELISSICEKKVLKVYTDSQKIKKRLKNNNIEFKDRCLDVDVAVLKFKNEQCLQIPIITLEYDLLKFYPQSVGAFFWQKGRPNIVFIAPRLKQHHIKLNADFDPFIEETLW
jgi:hypothetical protein